MKPLSVGQLARRTGLTVRTLHHYESLGLLLPVGRSAAGYRLYGDEQLRRLQHILSLKALGLSLEEIHHCLVGQMLSLAEALTGQLSRLRETIARQELLLSRLERLSQRLAAGDAIDADTFLSSIEASMTMEKYLTNEQLATVRRRGEELGAERIREVEQTWPQVIAGMQAALQLNKDPASDEVRALALKWRALVREFTGGDTGVQQSLNSMYKQEPAAMQKRTGINPALMEYACRAIAELPPLS